MNATKGFMAKLQKQAMKKVFIHKDEVGITTLSEAGPGYEIDIPLQMWNEYLDFQEQILMTNQILSLAYDKRQQMELAKTGKAEPKAADEPVLEDA